MTSKTSYISWSLGFLILALIWQLLPDLFVIASRIVDYDPTKNPVYSAYRSWKMRNAVPIDPEPITEFFHIPTWQELYDATQGFTEPALIRKMAIHNEEGSTNLRSIQWWRDNLGESNTTCLSAATDKASIYDCTFNQFFNNWHSEKPDYFYMGGPTHFVFDNNPILREQIKDPVFDEWMDRADEVDLMNDLKQFFLGFGGQGTPMHAAAPLSFFRQIVGSKEWTLINAKYKIELWTRYASHGFSHHTKGSLGHPHMVEEKADFLKYIPRMQFTIYPGDILINTPWVYHGTYNSPPDLSVESFNMGISYRMGGKTTGIAGFKLAPLDMLYNLGKVLWIGGGSIERGKQRLFEGTVLKNLFKEGLESTEKMVSARREK